MPINVTDFQWHQTETTVIVSLNLKKTNSKNVDIVCSSSYLKVHFRSYIFELFLKRKINPKLSKSVFKDGFLHMHLEKEVEGEWEDISILTPNKKEAQKLRINAIKEYEDNVKSEYQEKERDKIALQNLAISKQISAYDKKHEERKAQIKEAKREFFAEQDRPKVEEDRRRLSSLCSSDGSVAASEGGYDGDEESVAFSSTSISNADADTRKKSPTKHINRKKGQATVAAAPIRDSQSIKFVHSTHESPTPKRESLTKLKHSEDLNVEIKDKEEEKNRLKALAQNAFKCEDYEGAIDAYSDLIATWPEQASFYSNRAAAYIALNSLDDAVHDCSKALELLSEEREENKKSRLLCFVRRGTCFVKKRELAKGLMDYEAALKLDPSNESIARDASAIQECLLAHSTETETSDAADLCSYSESEDVASGSESSNNEGDS